MNPSRVDIALGLLALALPIGAAHAQAQGAPGDAALEEITVTAQRREERLQSTPVAVTAFSPETLERLQIQETKELAGSVPNLLMYTGVASPSMVNLYMRGAGEQIGGLVTSESAVGVYLDDVYQARLGSANVDLVDIERIEVLRGPQGTLYGRNSMTGALKIYTRTPDGPSWGTMSAGYGSYNEYLVNAGFGGAVVPDALGASISAQYRNRPDGWFYNRATNEKRGTRDVLSLRGKLALLGHEQLKATLTAYYTDDQNDGLTPVATDSVTLQSRTGGFRTTQSPTPAEGFDKQRGASVDVRWTPGGGTLRSITAYGKSRNHFRFDLSGGVPTPTGFAALVDRSSFYDTKQLSQELQWTGQTSGRKLDYILGAYYFDEDANQTIADTIFFTPIRPEIIGQKSRSYAGFAQGTLHFTDALSGTLGLRYTKDRKELDGSIATFFGAPTSTAVKRKDDWSVVTPKAGLDWQLTPDALVYGSISKGYRAGGYNGLTVANPVVFNTPFDPEYVWAYEVGAKTEWLERTLRLNVATFYNDIRNIQQSTTLGGGATVIQNVGKVAVYGAEIEITSVPVTGLEIFGHLTLQKDKYKELNPSAVAASLTDARVVHTPHVDGQIGFNYRWVLAGNAGSIRFGADASHKGTYFADATNAPITKVDAYTLVNAFVGWEDSSGRLQATLNGRNLSDEQYYRIGLALIPPNGIRFANEPPTWMANVKYTF
jgi:iron complex outermembrane receptor protein